MPRFMGFVRMEEGVGTPPQALFDAMDAHIGERAAKGVFLDGGGLYGTEDAVNFVVRQGEITRVDGPYAEAKEVVGGWAIMQYGSLEEAIADQTSSAIGDADSPFGGLGSNGAQHTPEADDVQTLRDVGTRYTFGDGRIHNLLADQFVSGHGDVTNTQVANAVLQNVLATPPA